MPARPVRGVLAAVVCALAFAGAAALAVPGLPAAAGSVGMMMPRAPVPPAALPDYGTVAPSGRTSVAPTPSAAPDTAAPSAADREAGILRRTVSSSGSGAFDVVSGWEAAPGPGEVHTVRVEVERGLPVDGDLFAAFVMTTLNDPRGWGHGGTMSFSRTDGDAPLTIVLASPDTSATLCGDVEGERTSCRTGPLAVLAFERWVGGTDEYADNLTGYRQYVVNHEVGHALGHGHELCPGPGRPAPVMQQQTLGLQGCTQNSWPYPGSDTGAS